MSCLSIIVCSISESLFSTFKSSVEQTIGSTTYEIIRIDNTIEKLSITKAYNKGARLANFDNLLFVHEDVIFHSKNWGQDLIDELKVTQTGIVGVAGSSYVPFAACGYSNPLGKYNYHYIVQLTPTSTITYDERPSNNVQLRAMDGVFLACTKSVWHDIQFDEQINGFHAYDLDFSIRSSILYKNRLTSKVFIQHNSVGTVNKEYVDNLIYVRRKLSVVNTLNDRENEYLAYREFVAKLNIFSFSFLAYFRHGIRFLSFKRLGVFTGCKAFLFLILKRFDGTYEAKVKISAVK